MYFPFASRISTKVDNFNNYLICLSNINQLPSVWQLLFSSLLTSDEFICPSRYYIQLTPLSDPGWRESWFVNETTAPLANIVAQPELYLSLSVLNNYEYQARLSGLPARKLFLFFTHLSSIHPTTSGCRKQQFVFGLRLNPCNMG